MTLPSDFLDQDGGQPLRTEFLVYAEVVDLHCIQNARRNTVSDRTVMQKQGSDELVPHSKTNRYTRYKRHEFVLWHTPDANVPFLVIPGRGQRPMLVVSGHHLAWRSRAYHSRNSAEYLNRNAASLSST